MAFLKAIESTVRDLLHKDDKRDDGAHTESKQRLPIADAEPRPDTFHRFESFAPQTTGHAKWYVDGCSYFWALSEALEKAQKTIYILDWWLSPELYLRRPPAANEQYRLDRMLKAAADRGVKVRVIVFKEVEEALTLNSEHTKKALEALSPNINVFRHPDHHVSGANIEANLRTSFGNLKLGSFDLNKLTKDSLMALYGGSADTVLFWAHHEKLCIVDDEVAFMGGLDACFGRWDTNSHPIADVHPGDLNGILFPGQDYNNARIYDFAGVDKWEQNKLDRTVSSRMGWSDLSISLSGHIVESLLQQFIERWNYIFGQKYNSCDDKKYQPLPLLKLQPQAAAESFFERVGGHSNMVQSLQQTFQKKRQEKVPESTETADGKGHVNVQLTRSCDTWSAGKRLEHSVQNAYIDIISSAEHFIYIENQFFITATDDKSDPVKNQIGAAIVDRIIRAHKADQVFRIIVLMPAVPAFAGDLQSDGALGTRAIMAFQYNSISRGGHSIIDRLYQAGIEDPSRYISFYNLRNFDRINTSATMQKAENKSGVSYNAARKDFDDSIETGYDGYAPNKETSGNFGSQYQRYNAAATSMPDKSWDTISSVYMADGPSLTSLPWDGEPESELDAYVSEELYIHTKILIADDRIAIIGSANLNDRSQLGSHDSEIAVVIEDPTPVESRMNGQPYTANAFAASLRRHLFRKHLGLLPDQQWDKPTQNFSPVTTAPNEYDWGSPADQLVVDPMSEEFATLWRTTAANNTEIFSRAFHNVPNDKVRNWKTYDAFFRNKFAMPVAVEPGSTAEAEGKKAASEDKNEDGTNKNGKIPYGHVLREWFPGGIVELKEWLGRVRGTLVEMPLQFLVEEKTLAKEGLELNGLTEEVYT